MRALLLPCAAAVLLHAAEVAGYSSYFRAGIPRSLASAYNPATRDGTAKPTTRAAGVQPAAGDWFAALCMGGQPQLGWELPAGFDPCPASSQSGAASPRRWGGSGTEWKRSPLTSPFGPKHYAEALNLNFLFYEAQRSGKLPSTNRIPWRGNAFLQDLVPGGYHDAGDTIKHSLTTAQVSYFLAWGALEFPAGYTSARQMKHVKAAVAWAVDYLSACHLPGDKFVGLIGHPDIDHSYWGRPEDQKTMQRPVFIWDLKTQNASDLLGSTSAALASASLLFKQERPAYAAALLKKAEHLFQFAVNRPGKYHESKPEYKPLADSWLYLSSAYEDNMMVGAAWLYKATGNRTYLDIAYQNYLAFGGRWEISPYINWDAMFPAAVVLLLDIGKKIGPANVPGYAEYEDFMRTTFLANYYKADNTWSIVKTPRGLRLYSWSIWGNAGYAANVAMATLMYAKQLPAGRERADAIKFARSQIDYILGSTGRSLVAGFGAYSPKQVLKGAVVGGPTGINYGMEIEWAGTERSDNTYTDIRNDYVSNEVSLGYNAGFAGALAGLISLTAQTPLDY